MSKPAQVAPAAPEAQMPAYMESFLAHLRLLVGVPFDYLVPDARLLPPESIRFFYLDRSWGDRLVDGAINVGQAGTREQAHHQAHHEGVRRQLDHTERAVRRLQVAGASHGPLLDFAEARKAVEGSGEARVVTGFLLRSAAVSGWPHMDVRAFSRVLPDGVDAGGAEAADSQLRTLRLERLSPSVLLALFEGVPRLVWCEEPHHGIQFGVNEMGGQLFVVRRDREGNLIRNRDDVQVPVREANRQVLAVKELRSRLAQARATEVTDGLDPLMVEQTGSANFAVSILNRPWRQRFQGEGGPRACFQGTGAFVPALTIAPRVELAELQRILLEVFR